MTISRVDGRQEPLQWGYDPLANGGIPANDDVRKVTPPVHLPWQVDSIMIHPEAKSTEEMNKDTRNHRSDRAGAAYTPPFMPTASTDQFGWDPRDLVTSAASSNAAPGWARWLSDATSAAIGGVKSLFGIATSAASESASYVASSASTLLDMIQPERIMDGVTGMTKGLWTTLEYLGIAFGPDLDNPKVEAATIPTVNPDGTRNPFGGRRVTAQDYKHLLTMQSNVNELLDILAEFKTDAELEAFVMALMKALAQDKTEDLDHLRIQLSTKYRDRKIDSETAIELLKKIRENPTYDWFIEATTHSMMAFGGLALGYAGGWGVPLVAFGALGLFNQYANHWGEKTAASVTATASSWALGGDYKKTHDAHTEYFRTAHQTFMSLLSIGVPLSVGGGALQGLLSTFMAIPSIGQNATNLHRSVVQRENSKIRGEFDNRTQRSKAANESTTSLINELGTSYKQFTSRWKDAHKMIKGAADTIREILRRS